MSEMSERMRPLVIINNAAARARRAWPNISKALSQNQINFDAHQTRHAGDATGTVRAALHQGRRLIAVVGGDGTLSEAAEGFFEFHEDERSAGTRLPVAVNAEAALAILPAGTGDDFARGLLGRRAPLEEWTNNFIAYCRGQSVSTRTIDMLYGRTNSGSHRFTCLNVATIGIGAEVAASVAAQKGMVRRLPGEMRFLSAALGALVNWRERPVRLVVDEEIIIESPLNLLAVANGIYAGGGMMFAPDARVDDALMNVLMASGITRPTILRELPRIRRGLHLSNPKVRSMTATSVRIETLDQQDPLPVEADGNVRGHTPATFHIMPKALRIVLGS